jgi:hypothetical protein
MLNRTVRPSEEEPAVVRLMIRVAAFVTVALVVACLAVISPALATGSVVPTVTVTASPSPASTGAVSYGVAVTDPTNAGTPTGTVAVSDGTSDNSCEITLASGAGTCALEESPGTYTITASYSGDSNYGPASGSASETVNAATPTVSVTPQAGAEAGQVSYSFTVAGPSGAVTPTGSVTVSDGSNSCGPTALVSGSGTCSIDEGAGVYTVTASYGSDSNYSTATGSATETVGQTAPATPTVSVTPQAGAEAGDVSYGVNVAGPSGAPVPTGSVTVTDNTGAYCTISDLDATGSGSCSIEETPGTYTLTASYGSDANYATATGTATETVGQATPTVTVTPQVGATPGSVSYVVSVAGPGAITPTGTVNVFDGTNLCTVSLADGNTCSISEGVGVYTVTASYSGDGNYTNAFGFQFETVKWAPASVSLTPPTSPTTGLVSYGVSVTGPSGAPVPTGSVQVTDNAGATCNAPLTNGSGSCSISEGAGSYSLTATYSGSTSYWSAARTATDTVGKAHAVVTPLGTAGAVAGWVTYSATVAGSGGIVPSGSVVVSVLPSGASCSIALSTGTGTQAADGVGSCQLFQTPTTYVLKFVYSGDNNYLAPSSLPKLTQTVTVAPVTVAVVGTPNPAAATKSGKAGEAAVTYSVTVTGQSDLPAPTGSVGVADQNNASCYIANLTPVAGAATPQSSGQCIIDETAGSYSVKAVTGGDGDYASGIGTTTEDVSTNTTTAFSKSPSKVAPGDSVTLTATVKSHVAAGGAPAGTVVFVVDGSYQSPPEPVSSVTASSGTATFSYSVPGDTPKGSQSVTAEFTSSNPGLWLDSGGSGSFKVS